ncbi:hypothetical protein Bca4012_069423 [Brassica carinata]|uniref:Uncharacterized protein n=1 Tax=Brassica carinata TaxID=52824 RepID=A0A8X8AZH8_BRACI|nr:hypothetical protein Bca52824_021416 [Brassica carinata]
MHEALFAKRGCCFLMPCLASSHEERWWIKGTRQWSDVVASLRWKTFIRTDGGGGGCVAITPSRSEQGKFRYDPLSYSLNFD